MNIMLKGLTQKGKNRVRENGAEWRIIVDANSVACLKGVPGFLIEPVTGNQNAIRWIAKQHDEHFEIVTK
jgi:hypothetical protein